MAAIETNGTKQYDAEQRAVKKILRVLDEMDPDTKAAVWATVTRFVVLKQATTEA